MTHVKVLHSNVCASVAPKAKCCTVNASPPMYFDRRGGRSCVFLTDCSMSFIMLPYKPHRPTDNNAKKKEHEKDIFTKFMLILTVSSFYRFLYLIVILSN